MTRIEARDELEKNLEKLAYSHKIRLALQEAIFTLNQAIAIDDIMANNLRSYMEKNYDAERNQKSS